MTRLYIRQAYQSMLTGPSRFMQLSTSKCENVIPGMYVNAMIETREKVTALPSEAIVSFDDRDYIFIWLGKRRKRESHLPNTGWLR